MKRFCGDGSSYAQSDKDKDGNLCMVHSNPGKKRKCIDLAKAENRSLEDSFKKFLSGGKKRQDMTNN